MSATPPSLADLNERSREIFRQLVETYLETGEPVGSRTLSRASAQGLSAATIRNVMQDLELAGLLDSPHVSAGRIPSHLGLRLFVDAVLEIGDVSVEERARIEKAFTGADQSLSGALDEAGTVLSGLSHCASLVYAPKRQSPVEHVEFVSLGDDRALAVLVMTDGTVENRLFDPPTGLTPSAMREAANFLNAQLRGRTLGEVQDQMARQIAARRSELDTRAASLVERGIALWSGDTAAGAPGQTAGQLIVRGRAHLLEDGQTAEELERIRQLFDDLERKRDIASLLDVTEEGAGVRVFIGSENKLFSLSGSSLVISPYVDGQSRVVGALGVIGPTRLNYGRIVPIVDYTARLMSHLAAGGTGPLPSPPGPGIARSPGQAHPVVAPGLMGSPTGKAGDN
ncbi:MAG: heat-inducible transcriptional repressor HrcA [Pseudomonadota bacterium]